MEAQAEGTSIIDTVVAEMRSAQQTLTQTIVMDQTALSEDTAHHNKLKAELGLLEKAADELTKKSEAWQTVVANGKKKQGEVKGLIAELDDLTEHQIEERVKLLEDAVNASETDLEAANQALDSTETDQEQAQIRVKQHERAYEQALNKLKQLPTAINGLVSRVQQLLSDIDSAAKGNQPRKVFVLCKVLERALHDLVEALSPEYQRELLAAYQSAKTSLNAEQDALKQNRDEAGRRRLVKEQAKYACDQAKSRRDEKINALFIPTNEKAPAGAAAGKA
jgi:hypothetical protein